MYAVIDIGSNTVRFVLYKVEQGGLHSVLNKKAAIGLAGYVDEEKNLSLSGVDRLVEALLDFQALLSIISYEKLFVFATASLRNIKNTKEVLRTVKDRTNIAIEVLDGEEEATLDYFGAKKQMPHDSGLMVDIGGGSTELAFFHGESLLSVTSLNLGSMKLYTEFCGDLFPTVSETDEISYYVKKKLEEFAPKPGEFKAEHLCSIGGSSRAIYNYIQKKKKIAVMGRDYPVSHLDVLVQAAAKGKRKKYAKTIIKVAADRIHTFTPGLLVLKEIVEYYDVKTITSSDYGVREGYLLRELEKIGVLR